MLKINAETVKNRKTKFVFMILRKKILHTVKVMNIYLSYTYFFRVTMLLENLDTSSYSESQSKICWFLKSIQFWQGLGAIKEYGGHLSLSKVIHKNNTVSRLNTKPALTIIGWSSVQSIYVQCDLWTLNHHKINMNMVVPKIDQIMIINIDNA